MAKDDEAYEWFQYHEELERLEAELDEEEARRDEQELNAFLDAFEAEERKRCQE